MQAERTDADGLIRSFTVAGEATSYRERLTYFSDCDRTYAYTHVAGIDGVETYDAHLSVVETASGATITMSADLTAPTPRDQEIRAGTQAIFDDGVHKIATLARSAKPHDEPAAPAPNTATTKNMILKDAPHLALTVTGAPADTLILFLHGIGGNRDNWSDQLPAVAPYCQAAALDLRGYGESQLGAAQSRVEDYCADILRVMDALDAKKLILCGLSYGAWLATSFAMRHPEHLTALVLSGGCTGMSEAGADARAAFRQSRELPLSQGQTPADFAPDVVDIIAGPNASKADRAKLTRSMAAIPAKTYADALRCFTNPPETFDFSKLNMPVLMMTGAHDRLAPPAEIRAVSKRIWQDAATPDIRFETLKDAGHVCNLECPTAYNTLLIDFLRRVLP